jgi:hypothetical protein
MRRDADHRTIAEAVRNWTPMPRPWLTHTLERIPTP